MLAYSLVGRLMLLSKCAICASKKSIFAKEEEGAWGPFTKNKERIQKLMQTGDKLYLQKLS